MLRLLLWVLAMCLWLVSDAVIARATQHLPAGLLLNAVVTPVEGL